MAKPRTLVTTSWDDGHPCDLRTAELLHAYGLTGAFYATIGPTRRPQLALAQLRELAAMGVEIGSHTLTHRILPQLDDKQIFEEMDGSKRQLEDDLGQPVTSVCYPKGKFNHSVCRQAAKAGYKMGRTTVAFHTGLEFDTMAVPVSCQFARLPVNRSLRHALGDGNARGFINWCRYYGMETDPLRLACRIFDRALEQGGVVHIWGHSWEMEDQGLWGAFEDLLKHIGRRPEVAYVTNTEVLDFCPARPAAASAVTVAAL